MCAYGLFGNFIYRLLFNDIATTYRGMRSSDFFPTGQRQLKAFLGLFFPLAGIMVPGVIVHLLCIRVILPSCDDRYIFYKDIHICMWVTVSMLNSHVLLCEHPQFRTMILGSLLRQLCWIFLLFIMLILVRGVVAVTYWGFFFRYSLSNQSLVWLLVGCKPCLKMLPAYCSPNRVKDY